MNEPQHNPNHFLDTLREMRGGISLEELSTQLHALVAAVQDTGKKGSLVYTLTVKPATAGSSFQLVVADAIKASVPCLERSADIFFATKNGELTRSNPNQRSLDLKVVAAPVAAPLTEVARG